MYIYNTLSGLNDTIANTPILENDLIPVMQKHLNAYLNENSINKVIDEATGNTLLHRSLLDKKVYLAQLLINNGAKNIENNSGMTPKVLSENSVLKGRINWITKTSSSNSTEKLSSSTSSSSSSMPFTSTAKSANDIFASFFGAGSSLTSENQFNHSSSSKTEDNSRSRASKANLSTSKDSSKASAPKGAPGGAPIISESDETPYSSSKSSNKMEDDLSFFGPSDAYQAPYGAFSKPLSSSMSSTDAFAATFGKNNPLFMFGGKQKASNGKSEEETIREFLPAFRKVLEETGNVEEAKKIQDQCEFICREKFENGQTAVHLAASKGHVKLMKWLMDSGAGGGNKDKIGQTAVHKAVINGRDEAARFLIGKGQSYEDIDEAGNSPIHYAAEMGNLTLVKLLTNQYRYQPKENKKGFSPLELAATNGHILVIQYLLKKGLYGIYHENCIKAIMIAAEKGYTAIINLFLRYENSTVEYFVKSTEYKVASKKFPDEIAKLLSSGSSDNSKSFSYIDMGKLSTKKDPIALEAYIKKQLLAGANIDETDSGFTCLQRAAKDNDFLLVKCLVECANAEINSLTNDDKGYSPLHFAALNNNEDMAQYLIWMGAEKEIRAKNMHTTPVKLTSDWKVQSTLLNYSACIFRPYR